VVAASLLGAAIAVGCSDSSGEVGRYDLASQSGFAGSGEDARSAGKVQMPAADSDDARHDPDPAPAKPGTAAVAPPMPATLSSPSMNAAASMAPFDWPFFGLDAANSRNNRVEQTISASNVSRLRPTWTRELTGGMHAIPAVVSGTIYVGDYQRLFAIGSSDGGAIWETAVSTFANSALVTTDLVYTTADDSVLAFDRVTGAQRWQTRFGADRSTTMFSSPVLAENVIVVGIASNESEMRKRDYTFVGAIVGVDKDTGQELWRQMLSGSFANSGNGVPVWSSAAVDTQRKLAFIGTGNTYEAPASPLADALIAVDYQTGELAWISQFAVDDVYVSVQCPDRNCDAGFDIVAAPNLFVADGRDAVGVGGKSGLFRACDRDTGEVIWDRDLSESTSRGSAGGIMATAAVGDDLLYVSSNTWREYGYLRTGRHDPSDTSETYALDLNTGETRWKTTMSAPAVGMLMLANGLVYQGTIDGEATALDAETGALLWTYDMGHDLVTGFSLVDGVLYGGSGGDWLVPQGTSRPGANLIAFSLQ
jgi:outer membrane protein assembly factor BamB